MPTAPRTEPRLPRVPVLGWNKLHDTFETLRQHAGPEPFPERLLRSINATYHAAPADLQRIPATGATIIVANHPFGMVETAALAAILRRIRPDIRFLANEFVAAVPELREIIVAVRLEAGSQRANAAAIRQAVAFVKGGGLLVIFPAGAVSHFHWRERASIDPAWNPAAARILRLASGGNTRPKVLPVFVPGTNSAAFHLVGMLHPTLRTAFLAHEFFNKARMDLELRIGRPVSTEKLLTLGSDDERIRYLRWRTYLLAQREPAAAPRPTSMTAISPPVFPQALAREIARLPETARLKEANDLAVYLTDAPSIPLVLREIGRLRERSFRAVGEGSGHATDLDRFDWYYLHLFVWNTRTQEVVGAYRLRPTGSSAALYTRTLFQFDDRFLNALGPAIELGRSFIRPEYQRAFAPLLLLWEGIGKFVAANPEYKTLFGPVSISAQFGGASRDLMISFLEREAALSELSHLVRPWNAPPKSGTAVLCHDLDELSEVVAELQSTTTGIPVLLRQYLRLGGRLLGFSVDRHFSNVLDGLIVVDLTKTEPTLLSRYLGKAQAAAFLDYHHTR